MRFVNLDQRTDEWKNWRKNGITATDSPVIAGISPYNTAWHLWGEKCGKVKPHPVSDFAVANGIRYESTALDLWNEKHNEMALPACIEWDKDPKWKASLDGLALDGRVIEIKCFGKEHLKEVDKVGLKAEFIQYCLMQVQHQILVADAKEAVLVLYDPDYPGGIREFPIKRDDEVIKGILERGEHFWECVQKGKCDYPPDVYTPKTKDARVRWAYLARRYREIQMLIEKHQLEIERLTDELDGVKDELRDMLPEDQMVGDSGGLVIKRIISQGAIDYKRAYQALPPEVQLTDEQLNTFRRKSVEKWDFKYLGRPMSDDIIDDSVIGGKPEMSNPEEPLWW